MGPTGIVFFDSPQLGAEHQNNVFVGHINIGIFCRFVSNAARDGFDFVNPGLAGLVADNAAELDEVTFGTGFGGITDLKIGPDGLLYVVAFSQGKIFAISCLVMMRPVWSKRRSHPSAAAPGTSFSDTDTFQNQAPVTAGASTIRYYLSLDTLKDAGDTLLNHTAACHPRRRRDLDGNGHGDDPVHHGTRELLPARVR